MVEFWESRVPIVCDCPSDGWYICLICGQHHNWECWREISQMIYLCRKKDPDRLSKRCNTAGQKVCGECYIIYQKNGPERYNHIPELRHASFCPLSQTPQAGPSTALPSQESEKEESPKKKQKTESNKE